MSNDVIKLNTIIGDIGDKISELAELGQDGFIVPMMFDPDALTEMIDLPMGTYRPPGNNLLWFYALKTTIYAHQMLEQAARIFEQIEDEKSTQKAEKIMAAFEKQFHPGETAFQVYGRLLNHPPNNGTTGE